MSYDSKNFLKGKKALAKDPQLKDLFARHKKISFTPQMQRSPFESLVRAIAHQQLHGKAAETILGRMLALFPGQSFPSADELAALEDEKLRVCGFSQSKTRSIKDIAAHAQLGIVPTSKEIVKLSNHEIIERLTKIFGVGKWTVEMLLIFQLGRLDVWPVDDFGVRKGFQVWQRKRKMPTAKDLKKFEKKFAPYQTIVSLYLWREADLAKVKK